MAWVNDAGTSFREERYPEYKSTREKLDNELQADFYCALERIRAMLDAFHIPLVIVPGYEADDRDRHPRHPLCGAQGSSR